MPTPIWKIRKSQGFSWEILGEQGFHTWIFEKIPNDFLI